MKITKTQLKRIIKEELGNALNEEGVSPKELGLPLDVGTPEKLLQGLSVLLNNPEQIQKDQIGYILNLINKQLMKNPDEATGDALRNAKTKLIDLDPARSSMASSRASRRDKFRDEAESAYAAPAGGDFYSTGGARFEGKTKLTNSHLKLIVKEELEALLGEEELEEKKKSKGRRTAKGNITQTTREKYATVGKDGFPIFDKKSAKAAIDLRGHASAADQKKIINKAAKFAPEAAKKAREVEKNK
jgi:hypothetical protein